MAGMAGLPSNHPDALIVTYICDLSQVASLREHMDRRIKDTSPSGIIGHMMHFECNYLN